MPRDVQRWLKPLAFVGGMAGVGWEAMGEPEPRLSLLAIYAVMMGLVAPDFLERLLGGNRREEPDHPPRSDSEENRP